MRIYSPVKSQSQQLQIFLRCLMALEYDCLSLSFHFMVHTHFIKKYLKHLHNDTQINLALYNKEY